MKAVIGKVLDARWESMCKDQTKPAYVLAVNHETKATSYDVYVELGYKHAVDSLASLAELPYMQQLAFDVSLTYISHVDMSRASTLAVHMYDSAKRRMSFRLDADMVWHAEVNNRAVLEYRDCDHVLARMAAWLAGRTMCTLAHDTIKNPRLWQTALDVSVVMRKVPFGKWRVVVLPQNILRLIVQQPGDEPECSSLMEFCRMHDWLLDAVVQAAACVRHGSVRPYFRIDLVGIRGSVELYLKCPLQWEVHCTMSCGSVQDRDELGEYMHRASGIPYNDDMPVSIVSSPYPIDEGGIIACVAQFHEEFSKQDRALILAEMGLTDVGDVVDGESDMEDGELSGY
jgi:hypothetical protein